MENQKLNSLPICDFPCGQSSMRKCHYARFDRSSGDYRCRYMLECPFKGEDRKSEYTIKLSKE